MINTGNLEQIFHNYIERFDFINNKNNREYTKWQIAAQFRELMDKALSLHGEEFVDALSAAQKCTGTMVDHYTQPFYGLVRLARKEPEVVLRLFTDLYDTSNGDVNERLFQFMNGANRLCEKYYPGGFISRQTVHSVTAYLFFYDPDSCYLYKWTECRWFAECVGFEEEWGDGTEFRPEVFRRMCQELTEEIFRCPELLEADNRRYGEEMNTGWMPLHEDRAKHILAYDIIHCCAVYGLYESTDCHQPTTEEMMRFEENRKKAQELYATLYDVQQEREQLREAMRFLRKTFAPGKQLRHTLYGSGIVTNADKHMATASFMFMGQLQFSLAKEAGEGHLVSSDEGYDEEIQRFIPVLKRAQDIYNRLDTAEEAFAPYADYID